jgi:hypothetical protein
MGLNPLKVWLNQLGERNRNLKDGIRLFPDTWYEFKDDLNKPPKKPKKGKTAHVRSEANLRHTELRPICRVKKMRHVGVKLDAKSAPMETLRCEQWLAAYAPYLEGKYEISTSPHYVITFQRSADASTFWMQCIMNKRVFSGEFDAVIDR